MTRFVLGLARSSDNIEVPRGTDDATKPLITRLGRWQEKHVKVEGKFIRTHTELWCSLSGTPLSNTS